jgi:hypothetical protein
MVAEDIRGMTAQVLSGVVVGVVVAGVGAIVSHLLIMQRERKRWEREDQKQREAFEREDQYRDHAERLKAYGEFMAACDRIRNDGDYSREAKLELDRSVTFALLVTRSMEVAQAINDLGEVTTDIMEQPAMDAESVREALTKRSFQNHHER